ncbi:cwf18 pre-mRNA splicing factor-domain-containing protein [Dichotomopilus funicola]|uniref:Cwf18 pre-mRNA splicing factor-domain-containing protein n=1 Tax=Dichotomopilus funicola TaxID=1934379 RepID=A0AAN6V4A6_9PEZI|nr:cwf18 pre-mRNA splicing factor-domain-containing protein [Dichotomopilus funicola]
MSSHATLSAASDDRKARLAKLKSLKRKQPTEPEADDRDDTDPATETTTTTTTIQDTTNQPLSQQNAPAPTPPTQDVARLHLSGRNYDAETKGPKLGFEAPPTLNLARPTLEQQAQELEEESRRQRAADEGGDDTGTGTGSGTAAAAAIDLFKLQPKKPNWDLKRELNARMEVLNVRTENAIAALVRERLAEKKAVAEGAGAGGSSSAAAAASSSSSSRRLDGQDGDAGADGMLDGTAIVEGARLREREEEEENRREREAEAEEFGMA